MILSSLNWLVCPPMYAIRSTTGKCYFKSSGRTTWNKAFESCAIQGGKLAEPTNAQEHQALAQKDVFLGIRKTGNQLV